MLVSDLLAKVRHRLMDDNQDDYRFSDEELLNYLKNAQRFVLTVRSDLKLTMAGGLDVAGAMTLTTSVNGVVTPTTIMESLEEYDDALADYACYKALTEESDDNQKQATTFYISAIKALGVQNVINS